MRTLRRRYSGIGRVAVLGALVVCSILQAQELATRADEFVNAHFNQGRFMGSVLLARDGKILFEKGYGWANAEWQISNSPRTKFRLGSITKQFTAVAILQLIEKGKLSTQDPVSKFCTDAPPTWSGVTVYHLLTHTSGIPSYTGLPGFMQSKARDPLPPEAIIKLSRDLPLEFKPGEKYAYNNSGYIILGFIIEKVSGMKYADYLRQNVLEPAGLADTGYDLAETIIPNRAAGYSGTVKNLRNCRYLDMTLPYAAGSLYSTVEDLLRWDQVLYTEKLITAASREKMYTPFMNNYGFGWSIQKRGDRLAYAHGGGIFGFNTYLARYPADRTFVAVLSNLESPSTGRIAEGLASLSWGQKVELPAERKEIKLEPATLDRYAGRYEMAEPKLTFTISRENDRLGIQASGQGKTNVIAIASDRFWFEPAEAEFQFHSDSSGRVTGFTLRQSGRVMEAKRIE